VVFDNPSFADELSEILSINNSDIENLCWRSIRNFK